MAVLQQVHTNTMQRAARLLQTHIVPSTDVVRSDHRLGKCERFTLRRMKGYQKSENESEPISDNTLWAILGIIILLIAGAFIANTKGEE